MYLLYIFLLQWQHNKTYFNSTIYTSTANACVSCGYTFTVPFMLFVYSIDKLKFKRCN